MLKKLFALTALVVLTTMGAAHAQDSTTSTTTACATPAYPPGQNSITVNPPSGNEGTDALAAAQTFCAGTTVTWTFQSTTVNLGTSIANSHGIATLSFKIPAGVGAGTHHVVATGLGSNGATLSQQAAVTVGSTTATTAIPKTGANSTKPLAEIGVAALAAGGLLVLVARRRRSTVAG